MSDVKLNPNALSSQDFRPIMSLQHRIEEAKNQPTETFSLGNGMAVERQGIAIRFTGVGANKLSPHAFMAAIRAAEMGGDAGRAMFATYQKTNADEFSGEKTLDKILAGQYRNNPPPPAHQSTAGDTPTSQTGTPDDDKLIAGDDARLSGEDGDDVMQARNNAYMEGGNGDDHMSAGHSAELYGNDGNDRLSGYDSNTLYGGDGDDVLSTYANSTLLGCAGNDRLSAYEGSTFDGGEGDDYISGYNYSDVTDMSGDNYVTAYQLANVTTGDGNDWISVYNNATVYAGDGYNMVTTYGNSEVHTGMHPDSIEVGTNSIVDSGGGDDMIITQAGSVVVAGTGNDRVQLRGASTYYFNSGDGHDIVSGGKWGQAYRHTNNLADSVVVFGDDIHAEDLTFHSAGNDLLVDIKNGSDSIIFRDFQRHGVPSMQFSDGTVFSSDDLSASLGPDSPYAPASQVKQEWIDAVDAYNASKAISGA